MITWKRTGTALLATSPTSSVLAPATTATSKKKVGKIYLATDSDIRTERDGGDMGVASTGGNTSLYYADSWEATSDSGDIWSSSKPLQVNIILDMEDEKGYYFSNTSPSNFELTLDSSDKYRFDRIKSINAKRKGSNATLILTVQLVFDKDADASVTAALSNFQWDSAHNGNGSWNEVSSVRYYQTQLIKDGATIGEIKDIYNTSYSFKDQIMEPSSYQLRVRSVKSSNSAKSNWNISGSWTVSEADIATLDNTVMDNSQSTVGTWQTAADDRRRYSNVGGSYPVSNWQQIDGQWYYLGAEGCTATGRIEPDSRSYYLEPSIGAMYTNTHTPDNYWIDESGVWIPGMQLTGYLQGKDTLQSKNSFIRQTGSRHIKINVSTSY